MNEEFITSAEVQKLLKISKTTLWRFRKQGLINTYKRGGVFRYKRQEVLNVLEPEIKSFKSDNHEI